MTAAPVKQARRAHASRRFSFRSFGPLNLIFPASLVGLLIVWNWAASHSVLLPSPHEVYTSLVAGFRSGSLVKNGWATLSTALTGFALGVAVGIALAVLIARFKILERSLAPFIFAMECTPKIVIAPLLSLWFGFGLGSKALLAALVVLFPVYLSTLAGLQSTDLNQINLFRKMNASGRETLIHLRIPSALPYIFSGMRVGIVFSLLGTLVAEFVGSELGLGQLLIQDDVNLDLANEFAVVLLLMVMAVLLLSSVNVLQRWVVYWK